MSSANVLPSAPEYTEQLPYAGNLTNQCRRLSSQKNLRSSNRAIQ